MKPLLKKIELSAQASEKNTKRLIISLRWMIFVILLFLFLYGKEKEAIGNIYFFKWLLAAYILSNTGLIFVPYKKFLASAIKSIIFIFDTLFISILIYAASGADVELYMAYFLVIFMAALGQSILLSMIITFFISIIYIGIMFKTSGLSGIYDTNMLIRIPFFFGVSLFSSYFAQEARVFKEHLNKVESLYQEVKVQLFQSSKLAAVGTLASGIVHEMGNLLQITMGSAESIKRHWERTEDNKKRLEDICKVTEQSGQIARQLLAFSRQDNAVYESMDVKEAIDESYELVKYNLGKNNVILVKNYDDNECKIIGNRNQIKQVMINFMNNARDAMKNGGKLTVGCKPIEDKIVVSISDEGAGIPEEIRGKIFSPFFTTKEKGKGTGLGLSISRDIITQHGGTINLETPAGKGTTFRIDFPREKG
jgi:signal transduction histidine kinase